MNRNSLRLLRFLLASEGLHFFRLTCSATTEGDVPDPLVSKEKENWGPVVRLKENFVPWLASAWQNSMHFMAKGDRSPLVAVVILEAYF